MVGMGGGGPYTQLCQEPSIYQTFSLYLAKIKFKLICGCPRLMARYSRAHHCLVLSDSLIPSLLHVPGGIPQPGTFVCLEAFPCEACCVNSGTQTY